MAVDDDHFAVQSFIRTKSEVALLLELSDGESAVVDTLQQRIQRRHLKENAFAAKGGRGLCCLMKRRKAWCLVLRETRRRLPEHRPLRDEQHHRKHEGSTWKGPMGLMTGRDVAWKALC